MKRKLVTLGAIVPNSMRRFVGNALCWAFGHKPCGYESGYEVCGRCRRHGYHSDDYHKAGVLRIDWRIKWKIGHWRRERKHRKDLRAIDRGEDIPF